MRIEAGGPAAALRAWRRLPIFARSGSLDTPTPNGAAACRADMPSSSPSKTRDYIPANALSRTPSSIEVDFESAQNQLSNHNRFIDHRTRSRVFLTSRADRAELLSRIIISEGVALSSLAEFLSKSSHPFSIW